MSLVRLITLGLCAALSLVSLGCSKYPEECHAAKLLVVEIEPDFTALSSTAHRGLRAEFEAIKARVEPQLAKVRAHEMSDDSRTANMLQSKLEAFATLGAEAIAEYEKLLVAVEAHKSSGAAGDPPKAGDVIDPEVESRLSVDFKVNRNLLRDWTCSD